MRPSGRFCSEDPRVSYQPRKEEGEEVPNVPPQPPRSPAWVQSGNETVARGETVFRLFPPGWEEGVRVKGARGGAGL